MVQEINLIDIGVSDLLATKNKDDAIFLTMMSLKPNMTVEKLEAMDIFQANVIDAKVMMKIRVGTEYTWQSASMEDVAHATRFQRDYTPEIIEDILNKKRCPADLHLYTDDFGSEEL